VFRTRYMRPGPILRDRCQRPALDKLRWVVAPAAAYLAMAPRALTGAAR
jgi:hypothetical protein